MKWKIYAENPEDHDDQGIYVIEAGNAAPTTDDEFDGIIPHGHYISDLESAQKWADKEFHLKGEVTDFEII